MPPARGAALSSLDLRSLEQGSLTEWRLQLDLYVRKLIGEIGLFGVVSPSRHLRAVLHSSWPLLGYGNFGDDRLSGRSAARRRDDIAGCCGSILEQLALSVNMSIVKREGVFVSALASGEAKFHKLWLYVYM